MAGGLKGEFVVSSGLSYRRFYIRRPKVCFPPPPPPPPPPAPSWPPDAFLVEFWYSFPFEEFTIERYWVCLFDRSEEEEWEWYGECLGPPICGGDWLVTPGTHKGELRPGGFDDFMGDYTFVKELIPIVWGVPTAYEVSDWDEKPGPGWTGLAKFTF